MLRPGDPGRALAVAQALLDQPPRMFNHARGLWGYTGTAPDGELLTVQATGMGGPSAALGANGALEPDPALLARLVEAGARPATVATSDLFYDPREEAAAAWMDRGAVAVEMEAATVLQVAARRGVAAACVLGVSDVADSRLREEEIE